MAVTHESLAFAGCMPSGSNVWTEIARGYAAFGSPFVPSGEDIAAFERAVATHADRSRGGRLQAVMLGVTPGLALMRWPQGVHLTAVDISPEVIAAIWPGDLQGVRRAIRASWFSIPLERKSCDVVIGDGSLATCRFPAEVRELAHSVHDLLRDNGLFVFRSYLRPPSQETVDAVFNALFSGNGLTVDCFKMRLYMAMQRSVQEGVAVREAARTLEKYGLDRRVMQAQLGWSAAAIEPFSIWPRSDAVYSFPTLEEIRGAIGDFFDDVSIDYPAYDLGRCCPTVAVRSRSAIAAPKESARNPSPG
jgi:SAM-dependent methyltransferase